MLVQIAVTPDFAFGVILLVYGLVCLAFGLVQFLAPARSDRWRERYMERSRRKGRAVVVAVGESTDRRLGMEKRDGIGRRRVIRATGVFLIALGGSAAVGGVALMVGAH